MIRCPRMARPLTKSRAYKVRVPLELEQLLHQLAAEHNQTPGVYLSNFITRALQQKAAK